jgi:LacI family transcriptional regulator
MREVARAAGVHVTTVSLALRNHASLPPATRQRIEEVARRMGYRQDPMLSALWAYRRAIKPPLRPPALAYLTRWPTRNGWNTGAHAHFFQGAQAEAERIGYQFQHIWLREPGMTTKRWNTVLDTRGFNGLIVAHLPMGRGHLLLNWERFCAVRIDPPLVWPRLHSVANNHYQCMQTAYREARRRGYSRIGFAIHRVDNERVDLLWLAGFAVEAQRHGRHKPVQPYLPRAWSEEAFGKWFRKYRPDVILSFHVQILTWLANLGVRVPQDVGFIDLDYMEKGTQRAGIHQNHQLVGATAVQVLARMIQFNERGIPPVPQTTLLDGAWVEGETLRPAPDSTDRTLSHSLAVQEKV